MVVLQESPVDMELLQLLMTEGQADVNAFQGQLLSLGKFIMWLPAHL